MCARDTVIRGVLLALETACAMMSLGILVSLRSSWHPKTVVWQSVGYGVRGMGLDPKEKLYAPAELDALCMVFYA